MILTVTGIVAVSAFIVAVLAGARPDKVPLWVAVMLLSVGLLLLVIPK